MKIYKFFILFVILFVGICNSYAGGFAVKEWHQENIFDGSGQTIDINLLMKVYGLKKGYFYNNWSYNFPKNRDIDFIEGDVLNSNDSNVEFNKNSNSLKFTFKKAFNGDEIFIKFKYRVNNHSDDKYTRTEYVYIPPFAVDAKASISVDLNKIGDLSLFSNNEKFECIDKICTWVGNVEKNGFLNVFELSQNKARWLVTTKLNITNNMPLGNLSVKLPLYYVGGGNNVLNLKISNNQNENIDYKNIRYDDDYIYVDFVDFQENEAFVKVEEIIENNYDTKKYWIKELDPNKSVKIDSETSLLLSSVINIIRENNVGDEPIHIAIAKWVYNNIIYNKDLSDDNLSTKEVFLRKEGVCRHISNLYSDMLRSINIPAVAVSGLAFDKKTNSFEPHSWTIVYYNGEWLPIDPTWNLYSGKLPISHIFTYKNTNTSVDFSCENFENFNANVSIDVKFLE